MIYQATKKRQGDVYVDHDVVLHIETGRHIPFDPANTDYQEYLEWLSEGNEPLPADPVE